MKCKMCEREVDATTEHHLIPQTRHKNKKNKKKFNRDQVKETVSLCQPCHVQIHNLFTEKTLERDYFTLEALLENSDVEKFIKWVAKKPSDFRSQNKRSNSR